jgi:predicted  nucleic acid-binding Zn-ribbon protein
MQLSRPPELAVTPKSVIGVSVLLLMLAAVFGVLNTAKVKTLRTNLANADAARDAAEHRRMTQEKELNAREETVAAASAKFAETETKVIKAQAELTQLQEEKANMQAKLQANESEIASLQKRIDEAGAKPSESPSAAAMVTLQAQLEEARRQLDSAEREKTFLSDKIRTTQEQSTQLEDERKRREISTRKTGVRGTVLAVNQAYNFVVLNLGGRQGVETNTEMLVLRGGTLIGRIRISSVEPSTAIGDIISGSLARGVQVQPGDTVIYAGTNS